MEVCLYEPEAPWVLQWGYPFEVFLHLVMRYSFKFLKLFSLERTNFVEVLFQYQRRLVGQDAEENQLF